MPLWKVAAMLAGLQKIELEVESGHDIPGGERMVVSSNPNSPMGLAGTPTGLNLHAATALISNAAANFQQLQNPKIAIPSSQWELGHAPTRRKRVIA